MSSSSKEISKFEKEKQKLVQEKCQAMLNDMLRDDDNKYCVDCDAKGPRWASWNLGIFLCIRCAGIHRNLGVHISRVKSVNLDTWTPDQVVTMQQMGNSRARAVYEANLPDNFRRPQTDVTLENFIRAKYEHTKYIAQEWVKPPPVRVDWNAEIEEQIRRKKEKKSAEATATLPKLGSVPSKPKSTTSPSLSSKANTNNKVPPPILGKIDVSKLTEVAAVPPPQPPPPTSTASDDLLGLSNPTVDPFASPVKSTNDEDLGGVFTAPTDPTSLQKMTNQSILSLYGNLGSSTTNNPIVGGLIAPNNPFAGAQQPQQQQQFGANNQPNNPFPQGMFGNNERANGFAGGGNGFGVVGGGSNNLSQLQQGLFSLNLGTQQQAPPPQQQPNNLLFNNTTTSPPTTNMNMMMADTGYYGGGVQQPPQQQPSHMITMQNSMINQFTPNGSGGAPAPSGIFGAGPPSNASNTNNPMVDLIWK